MIAVETPLSARSGEKERRFRVADPYLRFYLAFLRRGLPLVERGRGDIVLLTIDRSWKTWRGRAIEPVVREALLRIGSDLGYAEVAEVGGWWNRQNNPEIDIVAMNRDGRGTGVTFVGSSSGGRRKRRSARIRGPRPGRRSGPGGGRRDRTAGSHPDRSGRRRCADPVPRARGAAECLAAFGSGIIRSCGFIGCRWSGRCRIRDVGSRRGCWPRGARSGSRSGTRAVGAAEVRTRRGLGRRAGGAGAGVLRRGDLPGGGPHLAAHLARADRAELGRRDA